MKRLLSILCAFCWVPVASATDAQPRQTETQRILDEMRVGVLLHDPWSPERGSADISFQTYFARPAFRAEIPAALLPRPFFGLAANIAGKTSHVHAGLAWTFDLTDRLFVEAGLAGALHDGRFGPVPADNRNAMGCAFHFRESAGIGFRFDRSWSVIATVEHLSNGGLCNRNRGLTNLGVQLGYRF